MIRRKDDNHWLLIPQVEHARVAGELAAAWGNEDVEPLPYGDTLLFAVRHHDDGWHEWGLTSPIHPETGYPRDFLEMRMEDSTRLWQKSIDICACEAPEAGVWVSRHFCWLGERALETRKDCVEDLDATRRFLDEQRERQAQWAGQCQRVRQDNNLLEELFETGTQIVRFFDRLSLWLGCVPETEPIEIEMFKTGVFRFTPRSPQSITIEPYPFSDDQMELAVPVRRVPARPYASDVEFLEVLSNAPTEKLEWILGA